MAWKVRNETRNETPPDHSLCISINKLKTPLISMQDDKNAKSPTKKRRIDDSVSLPTWYQHIQL